MLPGILVATLFFGYIIIRCRIDPMLAPAEDVVPEPWRARLRPFFVHVMPLLAIFVVVVGSILGGFATPTESAALGSVATVLAALAYRRLTWGALKAAILETARISAMVLIIIAGSITFSQILAFSGATRAILRHRRGGRPVADRARPRHDRACSCFSAR